MSLYTPPLKFSKIRFKGGGYIEVNGRISRLGKLKSTRYSAYSSDMGIFDLKIDKFNEFCDFLMKKLDFEAFLSKYRDLCYGN